MTVELSKFPTANYIRNESTWWRPPWADSGIKRGAHCVAMVIDISACADELIVSLVMGGIRKLLNR